MMMFTSAECQLHAEQKLAQAERDQRHRRRLVTAAEAWLLLADLLRPAEAAAATAGATDEAVPRKRSKRRAKTNGATRL
jgi:hypothetical protein